MNKIIFLDFDGTMIPTTFSKYMEQLSLLSKNSILNKDEFGEFFAPHCVENLRILVRETEAKIIFSTNWKDKGYEFLSKMWKQRGYPGEAINCTPSLNPVQSIRGDEIDNILVNNYTKYVILDDMGAKQFHSHQIPHLVHCDERFGFSSKNLEKAIEILK